MGDHPNYFNFDIRISIWKFQDKELHEFVIAVVDRQDFIPGQEPSSVNVIELKCHSKLPI